MIRTALISPCGTFRYKLARVWDTALPALRFVMLNPSTADANVDDPTIRRCIGFSRREGYGGIEVLNLYALRATDPRRLALAPDADGPDNATYLDAIACSGIPIVCAWGARGGDRGIYMARRMACHGADLRCLGLTKGGHPSHPLYIKADQPLEPVEVRFAEPRLKIRPSPTHEVQS